MDPFNHNPTAHSTLRELVEDALQSYLKKLEGDKLANVYDLVLSEVEVALLSAMMRHTQGNQSKAASYLGLARGTLRKKLSEHHLLTEETLTT
jgi:Fis family transcriptional regulator, factor for inversion stimulation protein